MSQRTARIVQICAGALVAGSLAALVYYIQTPSSQLPSGAVGSVLYPITPAPVAGSLRPIPGRSIEIPDLKIALPLQRGKVGAVIAVGIAYVYPGTVEPGTTGNSYVYAHGIGSEFGPLLTARIGEPVMLKDQVHGTTTTLHIQRVVGRIRYNDMSYIRAGSNRAMVTLQTCIDDNPKGDRFIVIAW